MNTNRRYIIEGEGDETVIGIDGREACGVSVTWADLASANDAETMDEIGTLEIGESAIIGQCDLIIRIDDYTPLMPWIVDLSRAITEHPQWPGLMVVHPHVVAVPVLRATAHLDPLARLHARQRAREWCHHERMTGRSDEERMLWRRAEDLIDGAVCGEMYAPA